MQGLKDTITIYQKSRDKAGMSRPEAAKAIAAAGEDISEGSLKDYETGKTIPKPKNVKILAEVYETPELKWLHCSESCLLGEDIVKAS